LSECQTWPRFATVPPCPRFIIFFCLFLHYRRELCVCVGYHFLIFFGLFLHYRRELCVCVSGIIYLFIFCLLLHFQSKSYGLKSSELLFWALVIIIIARSMLTRTHPKSIILVGRIYSRLWRGVRACYKCTLPKSKILVLKIYSRLWRGVCVCVCKRSCYNGGLILFF
jgi:hypothetical protein